MMKKKTTTTRFSKWQQRDGQNQGQRRKHNGHNAALSLAKLESLLVL